MRMARGWSTELHLWETFRHALYDTRTLDWVGFTMDAGMLKPSLLQDMLMLTWHIVAHRAWSLSKHDFPPECCALAVSADVVQAQEATAKMRSDWANLMQLEQRAHTLPSAMQLWQDIEFADARPIRLLFAMYERDGWSFQSLSGRKIMKGLLQTLPDNKIVEDVHSVLRKDAKANANVKMTSAHVQHLIASSEVLESRRINHPAALNKEAFVQNYKRTKMQHLSHCHHAKKHELQQTWTHIMRRRTWKAMSEDSVRKSAAAWRWLQSYCAGHADQYAGASLGSARFSRLVPPHVLCRHSSGVVYASMGNATWGALGWPCDANSTGSYMFAQKAGVRWFHVCEPSDWHVLPFLAERTHQGVLMKPDGEHIPLMNYCLLNHSNMLTFADLVHCASYVNLETPGVKPRKDLLEMLAHKLAEGDELFCSKSYMLKIM